MFEENLKNDGRICEIIKKYTEVQDFGAPVVSRRGRPADTIDFSHMSEIEILSRDKFYMSCALELASLAAEMGEVPVGAVVVRGDKIISADFNRRETGKNAVYHAETTAIWRACRSMGGWRLPGCELYVTLEPCIMCAGAVVSARIPRTVFAAHDQKAGAMGSVTDINLMGLNHKTEIVSGIMAEESAALLKSFFRQKR